VPTCLCGQGADWLEARRVRVHTTARGGEIPADRWYVGVEKEEGRQGWWVGQRTGEEKGSWRGLGSGSELGKRNSKVRTN